MLEVDQILLAEKFQKLLDQERQAEQVYGELADKIADLTARQQLQQIRREKIHHMELIQRLLEIVD